MEILITPLLTAYKIFLFTVGSVLLIYLWFKYKFTYWSRRGVLGPTPEFPFGNLKEPMTGRKQFFQPYVDNYYKYKHLPYVGMYTFCKPVLLINDLEIAKHVLIKDFEYFQTRGHHAGNGGDRFMDHLFNIHGKRWKSLRNKLTPLFTTGKLKTMYPVYEDIANQAIRLLANNNDSDINLSVWFSKYTMELIGALGFGIECNGFNDANSEFHRMGHEYFNMDSLYWRVIRAFAFFAPDLAHALKIKRMDPKIEDFYDKIVHETVADRERHNYKRNDFLQLMIDLKKNQDLEEKTNGPQEYPFTMSDIVANAMLYIIAGYETSSTSGQFAAFQLALHPQIQAKVREEVQQVLVKYNGECTYDALNEMVYLNMVMDETQRMHPTLRAVFRRCTCDYKMPNTGLVIEKGTMIFIPNYAIQMDPDIFPNPERFDPERFTPETKAKMHPCQWLPFGEGPKKCIGARQGYLQAKLVLIKILQEYEIHLSDKTAVPPKISKSSLVLVSDGGLWFKLKKLNNNDS